LIILGFLLKQELIEMEVIYDDHLIMEVENIIDEEWVKKCLMEGILIE